MSSEERRAPGAARIPFDGLVEVGGTLGPSFEAQAVDVSEEGMHVRTAYLPELGQHVSCRFETARGQSVLASGDVVWSRGADRGGEFGIRFTEVDPESVQILKALCGAPSGAPHPHGTSPLGSKVRLYIDGLAAPMRAKIRDQGATAITVGSDLGFLQVGKQLELEDTQSGLKRPASIDRVEVAVDPSSHVPQLVVTLRYADVATAAASSNGSAQLPRPGEATVPTRRRTKRSAEGALEDASAQVKGLLTRQAARVRPVFDGLARRTRTALAILTASRRPWDDDAAPRRTTSPPPGGGLHASGRRVVRGTETAASMSDESAPARTSRRKAALAGAVLVTAMAGGIALKKAHHDPPAVAPAAVAASGADPTAGSASPTAGSAALASSSPGTSAAASASASTGAAAASGPDGTAARTSPPAAGSSAASDTGPSDPRTAARPTPPRPASFGNGSVRHGNVFHLHMDGVIETLQGAPQPTGFVVKLPGRKSLEPAAPLAARDSRIASIKVNNETSGAELTVVFRDGVPNYQVSARGDNLVIALAPPGALEREPGRERAVAKRNDSRDPANGTRTTHGRDERRALTGHRPDTSPER